MQRNSAAVSLDILFEDNHLLVVNKPAGLLSQPGPEGKADLLTEAKEYLRAKYRKPGNVFLGLVHRLDWGVGGVMVFARTSKAASRLAEQFRERRVTKVYEALVAGHVQGEGQTLVQRVTKDEWQRKAEVSEVGEDGEVGQEARLTFVVVARSPVADKKWPPLSYLEVQLESGKFHQIRAQLASFGHPIVGDGKYGSTVTLPGVLLGLRAAKLNFQHPTSGAACTFVVDRPPAWPTFA